MLGAVLPEVELEPAKTLDVAGTKVDGAVWEVVVI